MRRTIVVHTKLAGYMARVDAARTGAHGIQILTMGQMAARLAGGFLAPIDPDCLRDAVRESLPETNLGELENIKPLPGMVRAAVSTLDKVWRVPMRNTGRKCAATGRTPARPAQSRFSAPQAKNAASRDGSMSTFSKPCSSGWIRIPRPCAAGARPLSIPSARSRCGWVLPLHH